jgi:hypothetical protein
MQTRSWDITDANDRTVDLPPEDEGLDIQKTFSVVLIEVDLCKSLQQVLNIR